MDTTKLRDNGPYNGRYITKGAMIAETGNLIGALTAGLPLADASARVLDGTIFPQRARASRSRMWDIISYAYLSGPPWVLYDLQTAYQAGPQSREFTSLLYLLFVLRDHLTYDFVTQTLWVKWSAGQHDVSREDLLGWIDQAGEAQPQVMRLAQATRIRLAQNIITALRDFGLLSGAKKKTLVKPVLPPSTAERLLRILTLEGVRGAEVLRDPTWRLFLCREPDVADMLGRLAQAGRIRFEKAGDTVVLETPETWRTEP
jgi:hypothetical protein